MRTIYYLTHSETDRRLQYYTTLVGARIAQRQRNRRLGFHTRIERIQLDNCEYERCLNSDGVVVDATWRIEEATVDSPDLTIEAQ